MYGEGRRAILQGGRHVVRGERGRAPPLRAARAGGEAPAFGDVSRVSLCTQEGARVSASSSADDDARPRRVLEVLGCERELELHNLLRLPRLWGSAFD